MAPLNIEVLIPPDKEWKKIMELKPGDRLRGLQNITHDDKLDEVREVILFECTRDGKTTLYSSESGYGISGFGVEYEDIFHDRTKLKAIKELKEGESHQMLLSPYGIENGAMMVRFTHT